MQEMERMDQDPALAALRGELERTGYVVVPHVRHVCVRLPLLASVVVSTDGDALLLRPQVGPLRRSRALLLGALGAPAAVATAFATLGVGALSLGVAAASVAYLITDAYRLILTEGCVARLQSLWTGTVAPSSVTARTWSADGSLSGAPGPGGASAATLPGARPNRLLGAPAGRE